MTPEQLAEIRNRAGLARTIAHGPNALWRALASADDVPTLLAEVERLREHSITLNTVAFAIAEALGDVPPGTDRIEGNPIEQAQRLIAKVEQQAAIIDAFDAVTTAELAAEDTTTIQPCQPIGCDNGHHLPGCRFADIDAAEHNATEAPQ